MASELTEYMKIIQKRFYEDLHGEYRDDVIGAAIMPINCGIEEEMLQYVKENPEATLQDILAYMDVLQPLELEIVPDDELEDE
ncbi:MAG: DUF1931 family protein [Firmicutes bacterium]|nr:DUF1931 family protein [Bacillota bacterium]